MMIAGIPLTSLVIVLVEFFERFSYYSLTLSKSTFMTQRLNFSASRSAQINGCFGTSVYAMSWFGGAVADTRVGRFWTIGAFAVLYAAGVIIAAIAAIPSVTSEAMFFIGVFGFLTIASGGIKPVVSVFGADQIVDTEDDDRNKERFYSAFYWVLMLAAALASLIMPNVATEVWPGISKGWGYFDCYITAGSCMTFATILYFVTSPYYIPEPNLENQPSVAYHIAKAILHSGTKSFRGGVALFGWILTVPFFFASYYQAIEDDTNFAYVSFCIFVVQFGCLIWAYLEDDFSETTHPKGVLSSTQIRQCFQCLPAVLTVSATFTFIWRITQNYYNHQSCQMNLQIGTLQINGTSIGVTNNFAVMLAIVLLEVAIYPYMEQKHQKVSATQKFIFGVLAVTISGIVALIMEYIRADATVLAPAGWSPNATMEQRFPNVSTSQYADVEAYMGQCVIDGQDYCSNCAPKHAIGDIEVGIYMSDISAFWMALPFFLTGIGEALVQPVLQHYAYSHTPKAGRALVQAIVLVFTGMYPLALVTVFTTLLKDHLQNDLNRTSKVLGLSLGIEVFYYIGLLFAIVGLPLTYIVLKKAKMEPVSDSGDLDEDLLDDTEALAPPASKDLDTGKSYDEDFIFANEI